jgi:cbb3-type cytochrome oxidase subunit 3
MATEYLQFAGALVFFLGILVGSYWFVYVPNRKEQTRNDDG